MIPCKFSTRIPGVDYTESFSLDRSAIATTLYREEEGWTLLELIDIEAAFLESDYEEDENTYMEWPDGMVAASQKKNIKLLKPIYGGVDVSVTVLLSVCFICLASALFAIRKLRDAEPADLFG